MLYAIVYGGYALFCGVLLLLMVFLAKKNYWKMFSLVMMGVLVAGVYPAAVSQIEASEKRRKAAALSFAPDRIDFKNKKVIFVESDSAICGSNVCSDAVLKGELDEVFSTSIYPSDRSFDGGATWPFDIIHEDGVFYRMGILESEPSGQRLADPLEKLESRPDVDYTVVSDDSFFVHAYEEAFGLSGQLPETVRFAYMVFEGWPQAGQEPIARLLTVQFHTEPFFIWPISTDFHYSPKLFVNEDRVRDWFASE